MELEEINDLARETALQMPFTNLARIYRDADEELPDVFGDNCFGHAKKLCKKIPGASIVNAHKVIHAGVVFELNGSNFFADTSLGTAAAVEIPKEGETQAEIVLGRGSVKSVGDGFLFTVERAAVDYSPRTWVFNKDSAQYQDLRFSQSQWLDFLVCINGGEEQVCIRRHTYYELWEGRLITRGGVVSKASAYDMDAYIEKAAEAINLSKTDLTDAFERAFGLYRYGQLLNKVSSGR